MSTTLTPAAPPSPSLADSCAVTVRVTDLRPWPRPRAVQVEGHGPLVNSAIHAATVEVVIGPMMVEGVVFMDEAEDGQLWEADEGDHWLPVAVQDLLTDLGSITLHARTKTAMREAVQQYDREGGVLGDGVDHASVGCYAFPRHVVGSSAWDTEMRYAAQRLARFGTLSGHPVGCTCPACVEP